MKPTVFIIQEPWTGREPGLVSRDFSPAKKFGTVRTLLPADHPITDELSDDLLDAGLDDWKPGDFLLLSGAPAAIAVAAAVVVALGGPLKLLVYSSRSRSYRAVTFDLNALAPASAPR